MGPSSSFRHSAPDDFNSYRFRPATLMHWLTTYPYVMRQKAPGFEPAASGQELARHIERRLTLYLEKIRPGLTDAQDLLIGPERRFVTKVLEAAERWSKEPAAVVFWDIDGTLGMHTDVQGLRGISESVWFFRPALIPVVEHVRRCFPDLQHGIISCNEPKVIEAVLGECRNVTGLRGFFDDRRVQQTRRLFFELEGNRELAESEHERLLAKVGGDPERTPCHTIDLVKAAAIDRLLGSGINAKLVDDASAGCYLGKRFAGGSDISPARLLERIVEIHEA
jgi:hypothetical protein